MPDGSLLADSIAGVTPRQLLDAAAAATAPAQAEGRPIPDVLKRVSDLVDSLTRNGSPQGIVKVKPRAGAAAGRPPAASQLGLLPSSRLSSCLTPRYQSPSLQSLSKSPAKAHARDLRSLVLAVASVLRLDEAMLGDAEHNQLARFVLESVLPVCDFEPVLPGALQPAALDPTNMELAQVSNLELLGSVRAAYLELLTAFVDRMKLPAHVHKQKRGTAAHDHKSADEPNAEGEIAASPPQPAAGSTAAGEAPDAEGAAAKPFEFGDEARHRVLVGAFQASIKGMMSPYPEASRSPVSPAAACACPMERKGKGRPCSRESRMSCIAQRRRAAAAFGPSFVTSDGCYYPWY